MKKQAFAFFAAMSVLGGLAACGQAPGAGVVPQQGTREAMTLRAIAIGSPTPAPAATPTPEPTPSPTPQPKHGH